MLELVPLRKNKISSHALKTGSWYLLGLVFKISNQPPCPFYLPVSPPPHPTPPQDTSSMAQSYPVLPNRRQAWPSGGALDL